MDLSDPIFSIIASHPLLGEADVRASAIWWQQERWGDEGLPEFLVRQQVFLPDSLRTIDMIRKGVMTYCDPKRIFGEHGHARLREYAARVGLAEKGGAVGPPPPGSRISEVRAWLAKRAEARNIPTPPQTDTVGGVGFALPPLPKVEPRPAAAGPTSSQFLRGGQAAAPLPAAKATPAPKPPSSAGLSGVRKSNANDPRLSAPPAAAGGRRAPEPGQEIGKFFLVEQIGQGGTAVVFRALHRVLSIPVALKFLKIDHRDVLAAEGDIDVFEQLRKEAQLLARFNHPNIVRVFDFEDSAEMPFLVMEFVDGLSLADMIQHCGRLRPDRAAKILLQVADGLAAAQKKTGLVHRDIKPANILLSRDGSIKLADLGLALAGAQEAANAEQSTILAGTVAYMAPEQALPNPVIDHRSDIYSLGATFYHALTGEMPFRGKSRIELIYKHAKEAPHPPHLAVPGLDPLYSEIALKMLSKDPRERYQSYEDLLAALSMLQTKGDSAVAVGGSSTQHAVLAAVATTPD